ncbi:MAG: hypothetical protein CMH30_04940 [Micavibrio sp.]|nr:hypothetical protein [Micavibrio sp.]|tara:strand:- start:7403 stop:8443 length:1041 start_codon:yes stop_codon:yes gene_type:complete
MIKKRKIFYISGFDPRGPGFYHALYAQNAPQFHVSKRSKKSAHESHWLVENENTETDYIFLRWDDIIRQYWIKDPLTLYKKTLTMYLQQFRDFNWKDARHHNKMTLMTVFHLPLMLLFWAVLLLLHTPLLIFATIFLFSLWHLRRIQSNWLLRVFIFNNAFIYEQPESIEKRLDTFAKCIKEAIDDENYNEILLIGHSNGSVMIPPIIDRLGESAQRVHVITLGQIFPLVTLNKKANTYKDVLRRISHIPFKWLDISNLGDRACFPLTSPFKDVVTSYKTKLTLASAQFHKLYTPKRFHQLKMKKFDFHFLYLKKGEIKGSYDYAELTAGSKSFDGYVKTLKVVKA